MRLFKHTSYYAAVLLAATIFAGCNKDSHAPKPTTAATVTTTPDRRHGINPSRYDAKVSNPLYPAGH